MVVYVDVAFAINLCVDACLLFATAAVLRRRARARRVFAAAAAGSLYAVAALFPGAGFLAWWFCKWGCSVVMVAAAFGPSPSEWRRRLPLLRLLRAVAAFYAVTFAAGGAVYALAGFFAGRPALAGLAVVHGRIAWWTSIGALTVAVCVPLGLLLARALFVWGTRAARVKRFRCALEVRAGGRAVRLRALVDTGNSLRDPLSGAAVAVARAAACADLLPDAFAARLAGGGDPLRALFEAPEALGAFAERVRIVPYRGVGGADGSLLALRPDAVFALLEGGRKTALGPLLIALQGGALSRGDEYDCILPAGEADALLAEGREDVADTGADAPAGQTVHTSHPA